MKYATATQFLVRYNAEEITRHFKHPELNLVSSEMLCIAAAGGDLSGCPPEMQALIQAALVAVERALTDATQLINAYIAVRYPLPLTQAPGVLERIACQIGRYMFYDDTATDAMRNHYLDAIEFLKGISAGDVQLNREVP